MQVDKSIMLQKQIRDNSQDLQSEFLDMKNWEQQMKKADAEIRNAGSDQILPPVRKKKKAPKDTQLLRNKSNSDKSKRIKSSDYSSWEKFDVEKACDALDKENESSESGEEPISKEELEKNHAEATEHKIQGNIFVQKQQWAKAVACYNKAIKAFPHDAVFFANRALCHLKMDNLHSAEADCTAALQLDESYIKAYHRRATARIELKLYEGAVRDLKEILKLEPTNKQAISMLNRIDKSSDTSKLLKKNDTRSKVVEPAVEENTANEDTAEKFKTENRQNDKNDVELEKTKRTSVAEKIKTQLSTAVAMEKNKVVDIETPVEAVSNVKLPEWVPEDHEDFGIVEAITKAPHQRSKKPLRTVPIEEIEFGSKKSSPKASPSASSDQPTPTDSKIKITVDKKDDCEEIPEAPKTAVQFLLTWRKNKSTEFRHEYFKQIPAESIPTLFQDSMESNTFSEILKVLRLEFAKREEPLFDYLRYLGRVKRFRTLAMFMTKSDKEDLEILFNYAEKVEQRSHDEVKDLRVAYEM